MSEQTKRKQAVRRGQESTEGFVGGNVPLPSAHGSHHVQLVLSLSPMPFTDDQITEEGDGAGPERCVRGVGLS